MMEYLPHGLQVRLYVALIPDRNSEPIAYPLSESRLSSFRQACNPSVALRWESIPEVWPEESEFGVNGLSDSDTLDYVSKVH